MLIAAAHREAEHSRAASQMQEGRGGGRERQPDFSFFPHSKDAVLQCTLSLIRIPPCLAKLALHAERILRIRRLSDTHLSRLPKG